MKQAKSCLVLIRLLAGFALTGSAQVVTNLADSGAGTLRQVLSVATNGSIITFSTNGTITLTSGELVITNSLTILGPGATNLAVSGNNASRVFTVGRNGGTETAPMNKPHDGHTATLLNDGKVLVVGGPGYLFSTSPEEIYDPVGGSWVSSVLMFTISPRFGHTATLLSGGQVLVAGGAEPSGFPFSSDMVEIFDPSTQIFSSTGGMHNPRIDHTATLLNNGQVLVAGGNDTTGPGGTVEIYDSFTSIWTPTNSLNTARESHTATKLNNGRVLVAGGYGTTGLLASVEVFNPTNGTWTATNSLNVPREKHTATLLTNGMVLVVGGVGASGPLTSVELFNPATGIWTITNSLNTARYHHTATVLPNGKVLVAGGTGAAGPLSRVEIFDPATMTWATSGPLTTVRELHTATLLNNGLVLIAGGSDAAGPLASAELYSPTTSGTVNIAGLTIKNGHAPDGNNDNAHGGGLRNFATLSLTNCVLSGNTAGDGLDALYGFYQGGQGGHGGGIYNAATLTLAGCTLFNNQAGDGGDGSSTVFGSATVSTLIAGGGGSGGGVYSEGTLTVMTCTFNGNQAGDGGNDAKVGNGNNGPRGGHGGAIFNAGTLVVTAATLGGNAAGNGGAGGNGGNGGQGGNGGGIFSSRADIPVIVRNGLFAGNAVGAAGADGGGGFGAVGHGPDLFGSFTSLGHNLIGTTDDSSGLINGGNSDLVGTAAAPLNPLLGPVQANGGTTPTMALLPGSPAVDAGDDTLTGTDQRGLSRLANLHVDIGAYELAGTTGFFAPVVTSPTVGLLTMNPVTRLWSVTVGASVNAGGLPTEVAVAYGPTTNYGSATASVSAGYATTNVPVNVPLSGLVPGAPYHLRLVAVNAIGAGYSSDQTITGGLSGDFNGDGVVSQAEFDVVYGNYLPTSPWLYLTNTAGLGGTNVTFTLQNSTAGAYSVQYSTNLVNWNYLGPATPRYGFTDTNAPALPLRYYRLVWP